MATLLHLASAGELLRLDPALGLRVQEQRSIYLLPKVGDWLNGELPALESTWNIETPPLEQVDALFADFCAGKPLCVGWNVKPLVHLGDGIWELKTADVRIFGWFPQKDCFIATAGNLKRVIVELKMYRPYCEESVRFRDNLDLDDPKFIPGDDPNNVVSDCYYP